MTAELLHIQDAVGMPMHKGDWKEIEVPDLPAELVNR